MTEEEAKTKWCPFARESILNQTIEGLKIEKEACIVSDCMMWRLDEERDENMVLVPCNTGGHCGLAK